MCNHDINHLVGTSEGIVCRKCGKVFPSFAMLNADLEADRAAQAAPKAAAEQPKQGKPENAPVEAAETPKKGRKKKANA